jgi:hypothetical protein
MTPPTVSSLALISALRDGQGVLPARGDFSSPFARLMSVRPRRDRRDGDGGSTQVVDRLRVEPTGFCRLDFDVMVMGLHSQLAIQGASPVMFDFRRIPSLLRITALDDGTAEVLSWARPGRLSIEKPQSAEASHPLETCTCELAHPAGVYNEEAFQYLLAVEYKRFERSHRPFVLALIEEGPASPEPQPMRPATAEKVFAALGQSLRETDVIGWYREQSIVGGLLTHLGERPLADVSQLMTTKIGEALRAEMPDGAADRLRVKLYQPFEESWS